MARLDDTTARLAEVERALAELWLEQLPDIGSERTEDIVSAHRAVRDALRTLHRVARHP